MWTIEAKQSTIGYLKAINAQSKHIFIWPRFENEQYFMFHNDVDAQGRWKPERMVVQSNSDNYQVWIKSDRTLCVEEKKHWLGTIHSDPDALPLQRLGVGVSETQNFTDFRSCVCESLLWKRG